MAIFFKQIECPATNRFICTAIVSSYMSVFWTLPRRRFFVLSSTGRLMSQNAHRTNAGFVALFKYWIFSFGPWRHFTVAFDIHTLPSGGFSFLLDENETQISRDTKNKNGTLNVRLNPLLIVVSLKIAIHDGFLRLSSGHLNYT